MADLHEFPQTMNMVQARYGRLLYNVNDVRIGQSLELYGEYAQLELTLLGQLIRPGQVIVEVGSNIGSHTLFLARAVGPSGSVLAFEAQRIPYMTMCANMVMNGVTNVFPFHAAMGADVGAVVLGSPDYGQPGDFGAVTRVIDGPGEVVRLANVDGLALRSCALMLIDVYGMEAEVLAGAVKAIEQYRPRLYVDAFVEHARRATAQTLVDMDYEVFWHTPALYNPKNMRGNAENIFGDERSQKFFCLPKGHGMVLKNMEKVNPANL